LPPPEGSAALDRLAGLLRSRSGLVIGPGKLYLLETRLAPLLRAEGLDDLDGLTRLIDAQGDDGAAAAAVVEAMTTNETSFFRDCYPFEHLKRQGLPQLLKARPDGHTVRIWSAGASSGQEAYSIAMTLLESRVRGTVPPGWIIGTDIARAPLAQARRGRYTPFQVQRGLSHERLIRHFIPAGGEWQVKPALLTACQFRIWNLLDELTPLGRFDVVFCRNVLIYFDLPTKCRVLGNVARQLRPDGLLYLGGSETAVGLTPLLRPYGQERAIYQPIPLPATGA
jgi:chemotaxis protein methyltransferase CheR